jgi:hypothetical protein
MAGKVTEYGPRDEVLARFLPKKQPEAAAARPKLTEVGS